MKTYFIILGCLLVSLIPAYFYSKSKPKVNYFPSYWSKAPVSVKKLVAAHVDCDSLMVRKAFKFDDYLCACKQWDEWELLNVNMGQQSVFVVTVDSMTMPGQ